MALAEGISLNQFIGLAVAEKLARLEQAVFMKNNLANKYPGKPNEAATASASQRAPMFKRYD